MRICPCKDCNRRCNKCHASCKEYIDWSNDKKIERMEIARKKRMSYLSTHY